jgi:hypothetical protein
MKVRIIKEPQWTVLHLVQVKTFWWPWWKEVFEGDLAICEQVAEALVKTGSINTVVKEYP